MARSGLQSMLGGAGAGAGAGAASGFATPQLAILEADYNAFEGLLKDVQAAYSAGDLGKLRSLVTPEMLGYFSQELAANASRGVENKVSDVKLEQGDLSEAWSEGPDRLRDGGDALQHDRRPAQRRRRPRGRGQRAGA